MRSENHIPRVPPRKILVPLDLSESSLLAWEQALRLGKRFDARVQGLYVQEWLHSAMLGVGEPYLASYAAKEALEKLRARLGKGADLRVASGAVEKAILSWGQDAGVDLIVMGTHGRSGLERALKGSVAETVIRHATVPVLVTRKVAPRFHMVLAPVNFAPYSMEGLLFAAKTAAALGARLKVLHVFALPIYDATAVAGPKRLLAEAIDGLPARLREACSPRPLMSFGKPADEIVKAAKEADLVVLVAHRKGFLNDMVLGTTAERVLRHSQGSILALPMSSAKSPRNALALRGPGAGLARHLT